MKRDKEKIILTAAIIFVLVIVIAGTYIFSKSGGNYLIKNPGQNSGNTQEEKAEDNADEKITPDPYKSQNGQTAGNNPELEEEKADSENNENIVEEEKVLRPVEKYKDFKAKAIYYTGATAGNSEKIDRLIELARTTELNSVVIDVKEAGVVNYESNVPEVKNNKLYTKYYNPEEIIKKLHDNGVYVIARIVCFRDDGLARKRADLAIKRPDGSLWREGQMGAWTNPFNKEVWKYNIDIAKEAADLGFDEIQFDYVRFPTARSSEIDYGADVPSKADAISGFLKEAKEALHDDKGVLVSADVFGIIIESKVDGDAIGQDFETVGLDLDYICPMIYPSHFANDSNGIMGNGRGQEINGVLFTKPDLEPYNVVYNSLLKAKSRISSMEGYYAKVRPYLQDFTASYLKNGYYQTYGAQQVRQQINAVYDAGYEEWILWSGTNTYSEDVFERIEENSGMQE
ncbi:MAG: putative glycoside hydrolase [Acetivibrionales bacterium]